MSERRVRPGAEFAGRVVLVTGGTKGVGKATVRYFAERGAHVVINWFHSRDIAEQTQAELIADGLSVELLRASVAKQDAVQTMFEEVRARHGALDVLVNNAAYGSFVPLPELTEKDWARVLGLNFHGIRWTCAAAVPLLTGRPHPAIVNVSSIGTHFIIDNYAAVAASKGALEAYTKYLAYEYAPLGIRVNTANASFIEGRVTGLFPQSDEVRRAVTSATPLGRMGRPEDLAAVVGFLASPGAEWITGQSLMADGGLSLGAIMLSPSRTAPARTRESRPDEECVAVVGCGVTVPGASSPEGLYRLLAEGPPVFDEPHDRFDIEDFWSPDRSAEDKTYSRVSGYLHDFTPHPKAPRPATGGDLAHWLRHCLVQATESVRVSAADRVACYSGQWVDGSQDLEENVLGLLLREWAGPADDDVVRVLRKHLPRLAEHPRSLLPDAVLASALDGAFPDGAQIVERLVVDTACSSSLYAVDLGARAVLAGRCALALCGGAYQVTPRYSVMFAKLRGLSASGDVRGLDAGADGTLFTDGAAVVALKRLDRARADGDRILAVLGGFGAACDGRGKAINAPNAEGQLRAVARARARHGDGPGGAPQWLLAHATGTVAGDGTELTVIQDVQDKRPVTVTANKSVVGHTGWAAGAVSLVQAVECLRAGTIPAQRRFARLPEGAEERLPAVRVPRQDLPWGADTAPRTAGISGFGFGGTDAHLLVGDAPAPKAPRSASEAVGPLVLIAATVLGPGARPDPAQLRLPPRTLREIDVTQARAVLAIEQFAAEHGRLWANPDVAERTGVIAAMWEPPARSADATARAYRDVVARIANDLSGAGLNRAAAGVRAGLAVLLDRAAPIGPDTAPGLMPNVTPARITNRENLHGLALSVCDGPDSVLAAVEVAQTYLTDGDLELALVLATAGTTQPWAARLFANGRPESTVLPELAEGTYLFALTTADTARRRGWPARAELTPAPTAPQDLPEVVILAAGDDTVPAHLSAAGAHALTTALRHQAPTVRVRGPRRTLLITRPVGVADAPGDSASPSTSPRASAAPVTHRHVLARVAEPAVPVRAPLPSLPDGALVLTDSGEVADTVAETAAAQGTVATVVCTAPGARHTAVRTLTSVAEDSVAALALDPPGFTDVRVLSLCRPAQPPLVPRPAPATVRLQELGFLAARELWQRGSGEAGGGDMGSFLTLCLRGFLGTVPHPDTALLTGMAKSLVLDLPGVRFTTLLTDTTDVAAGLRALARETACGRTAQGVHLSDGERHVEKVRPARLPSAPARLPDRPVIVATGGARGITAACLLRLARDLYARDARAHFWLLGSGPEPGPGVSPAPDRAAFLRTWLSGHPGTRPADAVRAHTRALADAETARTLAALRDQGHAVHYVRCDVTDASAVRSAAALIRAEHTGPIDLFVHGAGINRSTVPGRKSLADFRAVSAVKTTGYHHLKDAFGQHTARWINFGSLAGTLGQPGEADYAAANDYLGACAALAHATGADEETIAWTLWRDVGMGSAPLAQALGARRAQLSGLDPAEGADHFLAELSVIRAARPVVLHLGPAEYRTLAARVPTLAEATTEAKTEATTETEIALEEIRP